MQDESPLLIITDSALVRDALVTHISETRRLLIADSHDVGMELALSFRPALILLDASSTDGEALALLRAFRSEPHLDDTFILVLSDEAAVLERLEASRAGADDFLRLPVDQAELTARVAVALRQARLSRRLRVYTRRIEEEMRLVADLQMRLLPAYTPYLASLRIDSFYQPSTEASGDYFDHFLLPGEDRLRVVIADASGHGARSAVLMTMVRTLFHASHAANTPLTDMLLEINTNLLDVVGNEPDFVTLFAADLDLRGNTLRYVNAGHCPALLRHPDGTTMRLSGTTPRLGFFGVRETERLVPFTPGTRLLLYTDGFHDCATASGRRLGIDRFLSLAEATMRRGGDVLSSLREDISTTFGEPPTWPDDVTALYIERKEEA